MVDVSLTSPDRVLLLGGGSLQLHDVVLILRPLVQLQGEVLSLPQREPEVVPHELARRRTGLDDKSFNSVFIICRFVQWLNKTRIAGYCASSTECSDYSLKKKFQIIVVFFRGGVIKALNKQLIITYERQL